MKKPAVIIGELLLIGIFVGNAVVDLGRPATIKLTVYTALLGGLMYAASKQDKPDQPDYTWLRLLVGIFALMDIFFTIWK